MRGRVPQKQLYRHLLQVALEFIFPSSEVRRQVEYLRALSKRSNRCFIDTEEKCLYKKYFLIHYN